MTAIQISDLSQRNIILVANLAAESLLSISMEFLVRLNHSVFISEFISICFYQWFLFALMKAMQSFHLINVGKLFRKVIKTFLMLEERFLAYLTRSVILIEDSTLLRLKSMRIAFIRLVFFLIFNFLGQIIPSILSQVVIY